MNARHPRLRTSMIAAIAVATLIAGAVTGTRAFADPEQPSTTATAPTGQTPGAVYANQPLPDGQVPSGAASGDKFSFWTNGADDALHLSVATLLTPKGKAPAGGWPLVVRAQSPNGVAARCSASTGTDRTVDDLLANGTAVLRPEYGAIGASGSPQYTDYRVTARNLLDAVQAGRVVAENISSRWAVAGDGLGSGAAIALARRGAGWEPAGLDFRGAVATAVPVGFDQTLAGLSPRSASVPDQVVADVVYALATLPTDQVTPILSSTGSSLVTKAGSLCSGDLLRAVRGVSLGELVTKPLPASLASSLRKSLDLPTRGFSRPLMLSQTLTDDSAVVTSALRYLTDAQLASNKVQMRTYLTADPADGQRQERGAVVDFTDKLLR